MIKVMLMKKATVKTKKVFFAWLQKKISPLLKNSHAKTNGGIWTLTANRRDDRG
jgi:hypothetical protein